MRLGSNEFCPIHKSLSLLWPGNPSQASGRKTGSSARRRPASPARIPGTAIIRRNAEAVKRSNLHKAKLLSDGIFVRPGLERTVQRRNTHLLFALQGAVKSGEIDSVRHASLRERIVTRV